MMYVDSLGVVYSLATCVVHACLSKYIEIEVEVAIATYVPVPATSCVLVLATY